jgi:hydrogenase maturation protein HypF
VTGFATTQAVPVTSRRVRVDVRGTVQGVGFRPFVFRLARALALSGFVRNGPGGVTIELEGDDRAIDRFLSRLVREAPKHARVGRVSVEEIASIGDHEFVVATSGEQGTAAALLPPDLCTCSDCLRELFDPADRRYRYPFINCTACGPRFTIARRVPYDRSSTTMAAFTMCPQCQAEYDDPADRRFHAQPNACPRCGPKVSLRDSRGVVVSAGPSDAIAGAAAAIRDGAIVAVKGLGGYHLACRADNASAVARLRRRKQRDDKPFALMAADLDAARRLVRLDDAEADLLTSDARPIVIARAEPGALVAELVAPARDELGVMLPYTPLHHLLVADADGALVMTSGNVSDEPIAFRDDDAVHRLSAIADLFLSHDRPIEAACEDSVVRVVTVAERRQPLFIRRSRGFVPQPIPVPLSSNETILATGGQLKNTACVVRHSEAIVGPHVGDLDDMSSLVAFSRGVDHLAQLIGAPPAIVAHDLHPDYASTRYALDRGELEPIAVQHHHAHFAACLAEHGETGPAIGLVFDGAGLGADGRIWGGEILYGDIGHSIRIGHLRAVRMPGGESAVREPWRMACAWLTDAFGVEPAIPAPLRETVAPEQWRAVSRLALAGPSPVTTSVGRLLDACAAMSGVRSRVTYEAQAAIEFEAAAKAHRRARARRGGSPSAGVYENSIVIEKIDDQLVIDPRELVRAVYDDVRDGREAGDIASSVHGGLVYAARLVAELGAEVRGSRTIALSGGVFQNTLLLEELALALTASGHRVLVPRLLPPNDGGLSYGQAVAAAWRRKNVSRDSGPNR